MTLPGWMTVKQAAKRIRLTDKRVYQLIGLGEKQGGLHAEQLGREYLVSEESVDRYLVRRKARPRRKTR